ncbi:titin isoform X1 [Esox lucius]|nr:titin isoform X1 [Esox lucius]
MEFPVDGLACVSQEVMERSAQEYMNSILYSNPDSPEYLTLANNTQVPISLSHVGFTPLYGISSRQKVLALFSPQDQLKVVGLYLLDRWWSLEDILKTADPNRDGCLEVKTLGERIVLYILNRFVYRGNEMDSDEIPFLCHAESDKAKILWKGGQAAGFYSVKPSGSLCSSYITQCYQLTVMDSIFVRKCHRGNGLGLQMLEDFVDSFKEEDCLGLKGSLSKAMYKVCEKFLRLYPADRDLLWEVESVGGPSQRTNIADKIQTMNMCVLSRNLSFTEHSMENLEVSENEVVMDEVTLHISEQDAMEYTVEILEEVTLVKDTKETEETPVTTQNRSSSHKQKEISEKRQLEKVIRVEDIEAETPKAEETEAVTVAESNKEELAIDVVETTTENEPGLEIGEYHTTETKMRQTSTVLLVDLEKTQLQEISQVEIENVASEIEEVEKAQEAPNEVLGSYHKAKEKETEVQEDKVIEEKPTVKQSVEGHEKLLPPEKVEAPVVDTRLLRRGRKSIPATLTGKCNFTKKGKRPSEEEEKEEAPDAKTTAQRSGKKCVPGIPTTECKSKRYAKGKHPQEEKVEKPEEKAVEPQKPVAEAKVLRRATATPRHKIPQTNKDPENEKNVAEPVSEVEEEEKYVIEEEIEQEEAEVKNRSLEKSVAEVKIEEVKEVEDRKTEDTEREAKKQVEVEEETVVKISVDKQNEVFEGTEKVEEDKEATVVGIVTDEVPEYPVEEHTLALKKATVVVEELKKPTIRSAMEIKNKKTDELTAGELVDKVPEKPIEEGERIASRKDAKAESLKEIVKVPLVVETRASASRSRTITITPKQKSMQIEPSVVNNEQNTGNAHIDLVKVPDAATVESVEKVVREATTKKEKMMERLNPTDKEQVEILTTEEEKNVEEEKKVVETEEDIIVDLAVEKVKEDTEEKGEEDKEAPLFERTDNEKLQKPVQGPAEEVLKSITSKEKNTSLVEEETLPLEVEKGPVIGKRVLQRGRKGVTGALSTTCRSTRRGKQSEGEKVAVEKAAEKEKEPAEARTTKRKPGLAAAIAIPKRKFKQAHKESEEAEMAQAVPELVVEKVEENEEIAKEKTAAEEKLDEIKGVEDKGSTEEWDKSEEAKKGQEAENKTVKKAIKNLTDVEETEKVDEEKVEAVVGDSYVDEVLEKQFEEPTKELVITLPIEENKALHTEEEEKISPPEVNEEAIIVLQRGRKCFPVASTSNRMSRRRGKQHEEEKVAEPEEKETAEEEDSPKVETRVLRRGRKSALAAATATPRHKSRQAQKESQKDVNTAETLPDAVDEKFEEKKVVGKEKVEEEREAEADTAEVDGKIVTEKMVEVKAVEQEGTTEDEEKVEEPKVDAEKDKLVEIAVKKQVEGEEIMAIGADELLKKPVEEPAKKEENGESVRTHPHKVQKAKVILVDMKEIILPVEIENMGQKTDELTKEKVDGKAQENTFEAEEEKAISTTSQVDMEAKSIEEDVEAPPMVKTGALSVTKTVSVATPKQESIQGKHSVYCNEQVVETEKTINETTVMVEEEALTETVESVKDEKVGEANPTEGENVETATTDQQQNVETATTDQQQNVETATTDKQQNVETATTDKQQNVEQEKKEVEAEKETVLDAVEEQTREVVEAGNVEEEKRQVTVMEIGANEVFEDSVEKPGLEVEKRFQFEEVEKTSPSEEEKTSTVEEEESTSSPEEEERTSPPEEAERTSSLVEERTSPPEEERTSPPEEEKMTSPPEEERTSPLEEEERTLPPEEERTSPPEEEKMTSPPEEEEKSSPSDEEEKTSPSDEEEKTSPSDEEEKTSPSDEEEKTSPSDEEEKASPSEEVEKSSPPEVKEKAQVVETRALRRGRKSVPVVLTSNRKSARRGKQPEEEKREVEKPKTQEADEEEEEAQDLETKVLRLGRKSAFGAITATPRQKYTLAHKEPNKETEDKPAEPMPETLWEKVEEEKAADEEKAEVELKSTAEQTGAIQTRQQEEKNEEDRKEEEKEEVEAVDESVVNITVGKPTEAVEDTDKVDEDKIETTVMGIAADNLLENPVREHVELEDDKSLKTQNLKLQKATVVLVDLKKTTLHPPVQIENVDCKTDELTEEDVDNETLVKAVEKEMAIKTSQEEMGEKCLEEVVDGTPVVEHRQTRNRTKTVAAVTPQRKSIQSKPSGDQNKNNAEVEESGNKPTELVKEALSETVESGEKEKMEGETAEEVTDKDKQVKSSEKNIEEADTAIVEKVQKERVDEKAYPMDEKKVERETTGKEEKVEDEKKEVEVELAVEKQKDEEKPVVDKVFIVSPPEKKMASSEEEKEKISPPEDGEESSETRVLTRGRKKVPAALTQKSSCYPKRKSTRIGKQHEEVEVVELEAEETLALAAATDTPCCISTKAQKEPEEKVDCPKPVPDMLEDKGANLEIASVEKENGAETVVIELKAVEEKTTKKERKVENEKKEKAQAKTSAEEEKIIAEEKVEEKANAVEEKIDKAALVEEEKMEALAENVARVEGKEGDVAIAKEKEEKTAEILEEIIEQAAVTAGSITVEAKVVPAKTTEVEAITEEEGKMEGEKKEEKGIEKDVDKPVGEAVNTSPSKEKMVEQEVPVIETRVLRRGRKSIPSIPTPKCKTRKREKQLEEETKDKPEEPSIVEGGLLRKGRKSAYAPTPRRQYKRPRKQLDGKEENVDEGPKLVKEAMEEKADGEKCMEDENLKKEKIDEAAAKSVEKGVEVAEMKEKKLEESTSDKDKVEEENEAAAGTPPAGEELGPEEKAEEVVKAVEEERLEGATPEEEEKVEEASAEVVLVEDADKLENDVERVADEAVEKIGEEEKGMSSKEGEDALVETRVLRRGRKSVPVTPTKRKSSQKCQQAEEEAEKLPEVAKRMLDPVEENWKEATEGELVPVLETKVLRRGRKSSNATSKSKRARKETEEEKQVESKNMEEASQTVPEAVGDKVEGRDAVEEMVGQNNLDVAIVTDQENTKLQSNSGAIEEKKVVTIPKQTVIDMAEQTEENEDENTKMITTEIAKEKEAGEIQEVESVDEKEQDVIEVEEDEMEEEPTDITFLEAVKNVQEKTVEKEENAIITIASQEEESAKSPNEISEVPPFVETRATRSRTTFATPKRKSMRKKPPVDYNEQVAEEEETGSEPVVEKERNSVVEQEAGIEEEDGEKEKAVESEGADNKEMVKQPEECGTEEEKEEKTKNSGMDNIENNKNEADNEFDQVGLHLKLAEDEEVEQKNEEMEEEKNATAELEILKSSEEMEEKKGPVVSRERLSYAKPITTPKRKSTRHSQIVTPTPSGVVLSSDEEPEDSPAEKRNLRMRKSFQPRTIRRSKRSKT